MTETQLWTRLAEALGDDYCRIWAAQQAVPGLDSRTVQEALADGVDDDLAGVLENLRAVRFLAVIWRCSGQRR